MENLNPLNFHYFYLSQKIGNLEKWLSTDQQSFCIRSNSCQVMGYETKIGNLHKRQYKFHWETVGGNSLSATDREQIAFHISRLPSSEWLDAANFDQICEWILCHDFAVRLAKCFLLGYQQPDNPLVRELEEGIIDQYEHDYIWLISDRYNNFWNLILRKEKKIKTALSKNKKWGYPFENRREFFQEIVKAYIEGNFLKCFEQNYEHKPREYKELITSCRQKLNGQDIPEPKTKKLNKLAKKYMPSNVWNERLIEILTILAQHDSLIKAHMEINKTLTNALLALEQKACCDPTLKDHAPRFYAWRRGLWYAE